MISCQTSVFILWRHIGLDKQVWRISKTVIDCKKVMNIHTCHLRTKDKLWQKYWLMGAKLHQVSGLCTVQGYFTLIKSLSVFALYISVTFSWRVYILWETWSNMSPTPHLTRPPWPADVTREQCVKHVQ